MFTTSFTDVLGDILPEAVLFEPGMIPSVRSDLGLAVPQTVKDKVTSGQYVDLEVVLPNSNPTQDLGPKLTIFPAGHVTMAPATQNNK
jgi:hypothetical protein